MIIPACELRTHDRMFFGSEEPESYRDVNATVVHRERVDVYFTDTQWVVLKPDSPVVIARPSAGDVDALTAGIFGDKPESVTAAEFASGLADVYRTTIDELVAEREDASMRGMDSLHLAYLSGRILTSRQTLAILEAVAA